MSEIATGRSEDLFELSVFAYGTLKPGGRYHQRYCGRALAEALPAMVKGCLYDFPQWGYPAMAPGEDWVQGYLLVFRDSATVCADILRQLDILEGVAADASSPVHSDDSYQRCRRLIFTPDYRPLQEAWIYQMKGDQVGQLGGVYLPDGDWPVD